MSDSNDTASDRAQDVRDEMSDTAFEHDIVDISEMSSAPDRTPASVPEPAPPPPAAAEVIDLPIRLRNPLLVIVSWAMFYVVFIALLIVMFAAFPRWLGGGHLASAVAKVLLLSVLTSMILGLSPALQRWRARRRVRRLMPLWKDAPAAELLAFMHHKRPWLSGTATLQEVVRLLPQFGSVGLVLRLGRRDELTDISPLGVDFEPRLLDQTDESFQELEEATRLEDHAQHSGAMRRLRVPEGSGLLQRAWRNVTLKEGRLSLIIFLAIFGLIAYRAYERGKFTPGLILGTIFLAGRLFAPATGGSSDPQWLVLPTGLIVRLPRKQNALDYVLTRADSVLGLYQAGRQKWYVHVADGAASFRTVATPREAAFLLRAWQSSVAPSAARAERMVRQTLLNLSNCRAEGQS